MSRIPSKGRHAFQSAVLESVRDPFWATDSGLRIVYWNDVAAATFGWTADEVRGRHTGELFEALVPGSTDDAAVAQLLRTGDYHGEALCQCKDGRRLLVEASSRVVRGPDGEVARVVCTARNITERRRAETVLAESEELFRTLAETSPLGVGVSSTERKIIYTNHAYEKILGYEPGGLLGQPSEALYHDPADRQAWLAVMKERGTVSDYEVRLRRKDGSPVWCAINVCPIEFGGKPAVIGLIQDATERKQAEEERKRLELELKADLDAMTRLQHLGALFVKENNLGPILGEIVDAAVAIAQADFGIMQILDTATSQLRIVAQRGFPQWWLDYWTSVPRGKGCCGTALERGERVIIEDVEHSPIFAGTPALQVQLRAGVRAVQSTPLLSRSGKPLGMFSTYYKTPKRPDDRALRLLDLLGRQASDIIERAQAEASIQSANAQLIEADRAKNEFLGVLSHELRNPLAPIVNSLYVLDHAAPGGAQAERARKVISRQVGQLSSLVNDLLDITRIARNKVQLQKERLELNELVRRTVEDNKFLFERVGVHLELASATRPISLIADRTRLTQVIGNLLQNAAKFTSKGGHTRISVAAEGSEAVVRVIDDGIGMEVETLERLFEPFVQAPQTLDRSKGGLGLGLALVKRLVDLHGGSVCAHSQGPGKGTELVVRLPQDVQADLGEAAFAARAMAPCRRVLIIDDNVDSADSLREALMLGDYQVEVAYDGPEGIAKAREFRPDIVLCDIGLPGMDGYKVAKAFRADDVLKGTFLIALSGYALPEDLQRAADAGFERHLAKPPVLEKLEQILVSSEAFKIV